ncbi:unnamed protein product [Gordionus sp. m RMFG-2023]
MQYNWVFREFELEVQITVPNRQPNCWARMGVFGQIAPTQVERRMCYCCRRRGHLAQQCPHLAGPGQTWEQSVWENEQGGDNLPMTDETEIRVGEVVWPKNERRVDGWDEGEAATQDNDCVGKRIREVNGPGEEEDDETAESNAEELSMLGEYLTPEFLDWL